MERDEETGLQCYGVRYYATWLGRWTSADPIGLGDGVNRYAYCHGGPVGGRDETGMARDEDLTAKAEAGRAVAKDPPPREMRDLVPLLQARNYLEDLSNRVASGELTDAEAFAEMFSTDEIGTPGDTSFADRGDLILAAEASGGGYEHPLSYMHPYSLGRDYFQDSGFREEFRDDSNQIQHALRGLDIASYGTRFATRAGVGHEFVPPTWVLGGQLQEWLEAPRGARAAFTRYVEHFDDHALDGQSVPKKLPGMSLADLKLTGQMFRLTLLSEDDKFTRYDAATFILDNVYDGSGVCAENSGTCRVGPKR